MRHPSGLKVYSVLDGTVLVRWSSITQDQIQGVFLGYIVKLIDLCTYKHLQTHKTNRSRITITGLQRLKKNRIQVAGYTTQGTGNWTTHDFLTCT